MKAGQLLSGRYAIPTIQNISYYKFSKPHAVMTPTLILVHSKQLLDQWLEKLQFFLDIPEKQTEIIGGGKRKPSGIIDVALIHQEKILTLAL